MDVCCKSDILYERVLTHVCQCDLGFFFLSVRACACVLHTCLSVSLKCLTVLSCPQSVKRRKVDTSKKEKRQREV